MLDIRQIRENPQIVQELLKRRGEYDLQPIIELDEKQRQLETERSQLQARSNQVGKQVGEKIKSGSDPKGTEIQALKEEGNKVKAKLAKLEELLETQRIELDEVRKSEKAILKRQKIQSFASNLNGMKKNPDSTYKMKN